MKFKVGQVWKDRSGNLMRIGEIRSAEDAPDGRTLGVSSVLSNRTAVEGIHFHNADGTFYNTEFDLIELVVEAARTLDAEYANPGFCAVMRRQRVKELCDSVKAFDKAKGETE